MNTFLTYTGYEIGPHTGVFKKMPGLLVPFVLHPNTVSESLVTLQQKS